MVVSKEERKEHLPCLDPFLNRLNPTSPLLRLIKLDSDLLVDKPLLLEEGTRSTNKVRKRKKTSCCKRIKSNRMKMMRSTSKVQENLSLELETGKGEEQSLLETRAESLVDYIIKVKLLLQLDPGNNNNHRLTSNENRSDTNNINISRSSKLVHTDSHLLIPLLITSFLLQFLLTIPI